jgi:hypothetical protein
MVPYDRAQGRLRQARDEQEVDGEEPQLPAALPAPKPHRQRHDGPLRQGSGQASTGSGCTEPAKPHRIRHDGFTPKKQRKFFKALKKTGCLSDACRVAGISRNTVRRHRDKWPQFDKKVRGALAKASVTLDAIAWQRAVEGAPEKVIRDGKVVRIKIKPSDSILRLLMQGADPERYGRLDRSQIAAAIRRRLKAEVRTEIQAEWDAMKMDEIQQARARLSAKLHDMHLRMCGAADCPECHPENGWQPVKLLPVDPGSAPAGGGGEPG